MLSGWNGLIEQGVVLLSEAIKFGIFLAAGFISGCLSSAPLGPINLWVLEAVLKDTLQAIRWFVAGVVVTDLCFAAIALFGFHQFLEDSPILPYVQGGAGLFLIGLGIFSLLKIRQVPTDQEVGKHHVVEPVKNFMMGVTFCGSNPGFLIFWLFVIQFLSQSFALKISPLLYPIFLIGVLLGDTVWFLFIVWIAKKGVHLAKPSILLAIRYMIAFSFLTFGGAAIWQSMVALTPAN